MSLNDIHDMKDGSGNFNHNSFQWLKLIYENKYG